MPKVSDPSRSFQNLVMALLFIVLAGYLLVIGKTLLLPIFISVISVYVLVSASDWLGRQPVTRRLPEWARRFLVLGIFICSFFALGGVIIATAEQLIAQLPVYQENLKTLFTDLIAMLGLEVSPDWTTIWGKLGEQFSLQTFARNALGSIGSLAGVLFMVIIYAMFLLGERGGFARKIAIALPGESAIQTQNFVRDINTRIGDYLAVKTLVNIILAGISFVVLWLFDVDFALFWAILIGLLNYIPFVGSMFGVIFPVALTMAQFGSLQSTLIIAALLTVAQTWVGNSLEPRMIGKKVNMSPFVVLVSLSLWSSMWGIPGAILAIPLTSIVAIILGGFASTRPFAILLAEDVDQFSGTSQQRNQTL